MKSAILICTFAILATCSAQIDDQLEVARSEASTAATDFVTSYSNLQSDSLYTNLLNRLSDFSMDMQTKIEASNEKIRTPYYEFYMSLSMGTTYGVGAECYQIAQMNLYLDVARVIDNYYLTTTTYQTIGSELQTLSYSGVSDKFYSTYTKLYALIYDEKATIQSLNDLTAQFKTEASNLVETARKLYAAIEAELNKLETKFNEENEYRVSEALLKIDSIKETYDSCVQYGYY